MIFLKIYAVLILLDAAIIALHLDRGNKRKINQVNHETQGEEILKQISITENEKV